MTHQYEGDLVSETIDPAPQQARCGRKLARYKRPATIVVVDAIPKTRSQDRQEIAARIPLCGGIHDE
jgi:acyl-CoA synthetase (AMP-forming)/AMP-acid ligase II